MTYSIEKPIDANLEDTAIPNLFITDFMPDVPDGDFVKVYIYAYMCCRQGVALTHTELAEFLGIEPEKVSLAWRYFSDRRIVKLKPHNSGDITYFDVEFVDVKGLLYAKEKSGGKASAQGGNSVSGGLADPALAALFQKIAFICGSPAIDGSDAQRILSWMENDGATPDIIEFAYLFCRDERGEKSASYVEKLVKEWAKGGLKTVSEVREYRAKTDARSAVHKKLMEALGLRYSVITVAEQKKFNLWLDDYGYTPERLLELADKTEGVQNKMKYLGGIIRKEREAEGKSTGSGGKGNLSKQAGREQYYREKRRQNEEAATARLEQAYAALPSLKRLDEEITMLNMELIKTLTSGMSDKQSAVTRLNSEIGTAQGRRKELLLGAGLAPDHTDAQYACPLCKDTGMLENGSSCGCFAL